MEKGIGLEIIKFCKLLYELGYIVASDGNISVRLENDAILITPSGKRKGEINESQLVVVDMDGNVIEGHEKPSMELWMHILSYRARPDIRAIVHAHTPYATAFSFQMPREYEPQLPEVKDAVGVIGFIPYRPAGSIELAKLVAERAPFHNALILQKHGIVCFGRNLDEAFNTLERVEFELKIKALRERFR